MKEYIPIGKTVQHKDGGATARQLRGPIIDRTINGTAGHESAHVRAAQKLDVTVFKATDAPGAGYAGYMTHAPTTDYKSALIAAAPAAKGYPGSGEESRAPGSDWHHVVKELGLDWNEAKKAAGELLFGDKEQEHIDAIGTQVQRKQEITGTDARRASDMVTMGILVAVSILNEQGGVEHMQILSAQNRAQEVPVDIPHERAPVQEL